MTGHRGDLYCYRPSGQGSVPIVKIPSNWFEWLEANPSVNDPIVVKIAEDFDKKKE